MSNEAVAFFVADLHLGPHTPQSSAAFFRFLDALPPSTEALYLLGDIFHLWIGDGMLKEACYQNITSRLAALKERKIALFWMHGNRDFLVGKRFFAATKAVLLPDPSTVTLAHQTLFLSHGDQYCASDKSHLRYRKIVHNVWVQRLFLSFPFRLRNAIAKKLRKQSNGVYADVDALLVSQQSKAHSAHIMIHGHTHCPQVHNHYQVTRYVLSDWDFEAKEPRGCALALYRDGTLAPFSDF